MDHLRAKANLPDLLACFLPEQIKTFDQRLIDRDKLACKYEFVLEKTKIKLPVTKSGIVCFQQLFPIHMGANNRDNALLYPGAANIGATVIYSSVITMGFYKKQHEDRRQEYPGSTS
jgi:hypothetical protein